MGTLGSGRGCASSEEMREISTSTKFLRLAQGGGKSCLPPKSVEGTNTIIFASKQGIPKGKKITYVNCVCDIKLYKTKTPTVCLTVGGNKLTYNGSSIYPEISLLDLNIHLNSVIFDSHKGARYITEDIINYYLNNPMSNFQYMRIHIRDIPHKVIVEYSPLSISDLSGYLQVNMRKGMYWGQGSRNHCLQTPCKKPPTLWIHPCGK